MSSFSKIDTAAITHFQGLLGIARVGLDQEILTKHASDETEDLSFPPELVLFVHTAKEISNVLRYCNERTIPVTVRGGGTGLSGGALAIHGGVVLNMQGFNKILNIDEQNLQVLVEPGVITEVLQNAVKEKGLFYPPDPSSKGTCFIGGNVSENSGGPRAVKYGVVKDYVLNLEVVLANGDIIWTGANVLKNATGFNLTQLMVGSEGLLGVITKIVLKLLPYPDKNLLMLVPFPSAELACEAVAKIFQAGYTPSALEFMERDAIEWSLKYSSEPSALPIGDTVQAHLLIEVDGKEEDILMREIEGIAQVLEQMGCDEILFADNEAEKNRLWKLRRSVAEAVKAHSIYKEEDTVVPRAALPQLLNKVKALGKEFGFKSVCYGHAGDGNLHVNIVKGDLTDAQWEQDLPQAIHLLFEYVHALGGTISGEHGIGLVQKEYMSIVFNEVQLNLMRGIKDLFDPKGILNPGKVFPTC
ncbi:MAG: FAD-binding protein [Chitinophagales bacterium]|nr:FAD-binding protein [Chitinophagales bacterium]